MEQIAKDKEAKFKEEQAAASRRAELNENVKMWQEEEKKVNFIVGDQSLLGKFLMFL
jgi:hypothetical protein